MPIYGECGGLMYLGSEIGTNGCTYKMVDALPGTIIMTKKLQILGYVKANMIRSNPLVDM